MLLWVWTLGSEKVCLQFSVIHLLTIGPKCAQLQNVYRKALSTYSSLAVDQSRGSIWAVRVVSLLLDVDPRFPFSTAHNPTTTSLKSTLSTLRREFFQKAFTVTLAAMFLGAMPRRPDKAEAHKTLRQHLTYLGLWICAIRAAPFIFALVSKQNEQLELDFD